MRISTKEALSRCPKTAEACDDDFEEEPDDECEHAFMCLSKAECPDHLNLLSCGEYKTARSNMRERKAIEKGQRRIV